MKEQLEDIAPDTKYDGPYSYHGADISAYGVEIWDKETIKKFRELEKIGIENVEMSEPVIRGCDQEENTWHDRLIRVTTKDGEHHEICDSWKS